MRGSEHILMTQTDDYFDTYHKSNESYKEIPRRDDFAATGDDFGGDCQAAQTAQDCAPGRPPPTKRAFPTGMPAPRLLTHVKVPTWPDLGLTIYVCLPRAMTQVRLLPSPGLRQ